MNRKHFLMTWPNLDFKDGFYVEQKSGQYWIGHLTKNDRDKFYQDHRQQISREAYLLLKKQAINFRRRILKILQDRKK